MFHKRSCQCLHCTEIFKNTKIPVDGIKVKFGAKVNSDQIKQSIKQNKSNLESWKKSNNQTLKVGRFGRFGRFGNQTIKLENWKKSNNEIGKLEDFEELGKL